MTEQEEKNHRDYIKNNPTKKFYRVSYTVENKSNKSKIRLTSYFRSNVPLCLASDILQRNSAEVYDSEKYTFKNDIKIIGYDQLPPYSHKGLFISQYEYEAYKKKLAF